MEVVGPVVPGHARHCRVLAEETLEAGALAVVVDDDGELIDALRVGAQTALGRDPLVDRAADVDRRLLTLEAVGEQRTLCLVVAPVAQAILLRVRTARL